MDVSQRPGIFVVIVSPDILIDGIKIDRWLIFMVLLEKDLSQHQEKRRVV